MARERILIPPRWWYGVSFAVLVTAAVVLTTQHHGVAALLGVASGLALLFFGAVPRANRHNTTRTAILAATSTLAVTWTISFFGAALYAAYIASSAHAEKWIPIALLAMTNVGGLVAVFRSAQTRTETSAALREVSDLRIAVLTAPIIEAADRASRAKTFEDLTASLVSMLQLAVGLSLLPRVVDQATLWALDETHREWFICAATVKAGEQQFKQPQIDRETAGAGMIANFAYGAAVPVRPGSLQRGDVYLIGGDLSTHPWFKPNPDQPRTATGIAIILLRRDDKAAGALCFTWQDLEVPTEGSHANEMIDILERWAHAFGVGLSRLYSLRDQLPRR